MCCKGLGACHPDFDTRARDVVQTAFAHQGALRHVADRERLVHAAALRKFERRNRIRGFARLRNRHHKRLRIRHGRAVAVFTGHFRVAGDARHRLQPVLGGKRRVVARSAGKHQNALDARENLCRLTAENRGRDAFHAFERVGNCAGLLKDFLLHVVAVGSELCRTRIRLHPHGLAANSRIVRPFVRKNPDVSKRHVSHITVFKENDVVGDACQSHCVASHEISGLT